MGKIINFDDYIREPELDVFGKCEECEEDIYIGDVCHYVEGSGYVHPECLLIFLRRIDAVKDVVAGEEEIMDDDEI